MSDPSPERRALFYNTSIKSLRKMKCKECGWEFQPWKRDILCTWGCEDGVYESERDYATVFVSCAGCKGTGEQTITEDEFCSEDCIEDHVYKSQDEI